MAKAGKVAKGREKAEDEGSSHGRVEAQEEEEVEEAEQLEEEWLAAGLQAPEPILDQCSHRRVANRGAVVPDPAPATKKVKKITSKGSKPDAVRRQSSHLAEAKTPPAKQSVAAGVDSSSQSGSSSPQSSSSEEEEETETLIHRSKRLRRAGLPKTMEGTSLAGSSTNDPLPSPQLSPRQKSTGLAPPVGSDAGELPTSSAGGGGEMTQGEPPQEGLTPPTDQVEEPPMMASMGEPAQDDAVVVMEGDGNHGPITDVAGETEASARQTSPVPQAEEHELLEEVASIGRDAIDEAAKIVVAEGQGHAAGSVQEPLTETEQIPDSVPGAGAMVEEKTPFQTMDPPTS
nr:uncharacterized protein LOC109748156 [Aegilops tauschii subsp. strangulata]